MDNNKTEHIVISKQEYAEFVHAVNTHYFLRFVGRGVAYIATGNCGYRFKIIEFGGLEILNRKDLK